MNRLLPLIGFTLALTAPASAWTRDATEHLPNALATPYRLEYEDHVLSESDQIAALEAALRFYSPPRSQVRWLDTEALPAFPGAPASHHDAALVDALVARMGPRFLRWRGEVNGPGVRMLWAGPFAMSEDTARIIVGSRFMTAYAPGPLTHQVLVVTRRGGGWRITSRGGVLSELNGR